MKRKTLHLVLVQKWFDMILSGEKKEEYREIKHHWCKRLIEGYCGCGGDKSCNKGSFPEYAIDGFKNEKYHINFKNFDTITFRNGYSKEARRFEIELMNIDINTGNEVWGAEKDTKYFVLHLGKILNKEYC